MKFLFYLIAIAACVVSCQPSLRISGTTPSDNPITISHNINGEQEVFATITPHNGKFTHKIKQIDKPEAFLLLVDLKQTFGHFFIGENGQLHITIDTTGTIRVIGTELNNRLQKYHDQRNLLQASFKEIYFPHQEKRAKEKEASQVELDQLKEAASILDSLERNIIASDIRFIVENVNNVAGQLVLSNLVLHSPTVEQLEEIINAANAETQQTESYKRIANHIKQAKQTAQGKSYTDVALKLPNGEDTSIADYLNKKQYTLLYIYIPSYFVEYDFFLLDKLYKQHQDNSVEMVSIAIDENTKSWRKILDKYNMPWAQLIDITGVDGNLSTTYDLGTFPHYILLNKNGTILLRSTNINKLTDMLKPKQL